MARASLSEGRGHSHQYNSGQPSKSPQFTPDAVLINYFRRAGCLHIKALWLLKWLLCSGHVQGPGMQRCCSGCEERRQRNSAQEGRQNLFALFPHVQRSGDKADKKPPASKHRISSRSCLHVNKNKQKTQTNEQNRTFSPLLWLLPISFFLR